MGNCFECQSSLEDLAVAIIGFSYLSFKEILFYYPEDDYYDLAQAYAELDGSPHAIKYYESALGANPYHLPSLLDLARAYESLGDMRAARDKWVELRDRANLMQEIAFYDQAIKHLPD